MEDYVSFLYTPHQWWTWYHQHRRSYTWKLSNLRAGILSSNFFISSQGPSPTPISTIERGYMLVIKMFEINTYFNIIETVYPWFSKRSLAQLGKLSSLKRQSKYNEKTQPRKIQRDNGVSLGMTQTTGTTVIQLKKYKTPKEIIPLTM